MQIPTTLPTLDELIGTDGLSADGACQHLLRAHPAQHSADQVFTAHAELEGGQLAPQFERLLGGWIERRALRSCRCASSPHRPSVSICHGIVVEMGPIAGRSGVLALQGARVAQA